MNLEDLGNIGEFMGAIGVVIHRSRTQWRSTSVSRVALSPTMLGACFSLLLLLPAIVTADEIEPFTSDGCSAFPDGTIEQSSLWLKCCTEHDRAYWMGGTQKDRESADQALKSCVASMGHPHIAELMLSGVRVGGTPYLPTRFRWGYGWPYPRGYEPLTDPQRQKLVEQSKREQAE